MQAVDFIGQLSYRVSACPHTDSRIIATEEATPPAVT